MEDRRRFTRWTIADKVYYKQEGSSEEYECLSKDISCSGMCFSPSKAVTPNSDLDLKIYVGNDYSPVLVKGKVVWVAPSMSSADAPFLAGVHFDSIKDSDKDAIFNYVYQNNRDQIVKRWWQGV